MLWVYSLLIWSLCVLFGHIVHSDFLVVPLMAVALSGNFEASHVGIGWFLYTLIKPLGETRQVKIRTWDPGPTWTFTTWPPSQWNVKYYSTNVCVWFLILSLLNFNLLYMWFPLLFVSTVIIPSNFSPFFKYLIIWDAVLNIWCLPVVGHNSINIVHIMFIPCLQF